jgi:hypothetical protein
MPSTKFPKICGRRGVQAGVAEGFPHSCMRVSSRRQAIKPTHALTSHRSCAHQGVIGAVALSAVPGRHRSWCPFAAGPPVSRIPGAGPNDLSIPGFLTGAGGTSCGRLLPHSCLRPRVPPSVPVQARRVAIQTISSPVAPGFATSLKWVFGRRRSVR